MTDFICRMHKASSRGVCSMPDQVTLTGEKCTRGRLQERQMTRKPHRGCNLAQVLGLGVQLALLYLLRGHKVGQGTCCCQEHLILHMKRLSFR